MEIGNAYRKARLFTGLTLYELSNRTHPKISVTQLSLFERDLISLPSDKVEQLNKLLDVETIGGQNEQ